MHQQAAVGARVRAPESIALLEWDLAWAPADPRTSASHQHVPMGIAVIPA